MPRGMPGWPELAFSTMSAERIRRASAKIFIGENGVMMSIIVCRSAVVGSKRFCYGDRMIHEPLQFGQG